MSEKLTEPLPRNTGRMSAAVAILGLGLELLGGCSGQTGTAEPITAPTTQPPSSAQHTGRVLEQCTAEHLDKIRAIPDNFNVALAANWLGVAAARLANGELVFADCTEGMPVDSVANGTAIIRVVGLPKNLNVDNRCLVITVDVTPTRGAVAHHVAAVCPAA